jgi:hypothetical protein
MQSPHLQAVLVRLKFGHECPNFLGFLGLLSACMRSHSPHIICRISTLKNVMRHTICKATSFAIVGPYTLSVGFDDGMFKEIDFSPILQGELYGPLRDLRLFEQVSLDGEVHTLAWPNGADFDPATLHDWPSQSGEVTSALKHWRQQNETASKAT